MAASFLWDRGMAPLVVNDWAEVYFHMAAARDAVLDQGALPLWCPWINGGYPLASHPCDPSLSPLFPVVLAAGQALAPRINAVIFFLLGVLGMGLFASRGLKLSSWGTLAATGLYAVSGWLPARFYSGNYNECSYFLFPLVLYFAWRAGRDRRFAVAGGLTLYVMLAEGKFTYPSVLLFAFLYWALERLLARREGRSLTFRSLAAMTGASALFGILKLRLLFTLLSADPYTRDYAQGRFLVSLADQGWLLARMIRHHWLAVASFPPEIHEPGMMFFSAGGMTLPMGGHYLGIGTAALALALAAAVLRPRRFLAPLVLVLAALALALGDYSRQNLFFLLNLVPPFSSMANPMKYFSYFILFGLCVGVGGCFHILEEKLTGKSRLARVLAGALAVGLLLPPLLANVRIVPSLFSSPPPREQAAREFFQADRGPVYLLYQQGLGVLDWCGNIVLPTAVVPAALLTEDNPVAGPYQKISGQYIRNPSYQGEAWLAEGKGEARLERVGFNEILVQAHVREPDVLVVNQNPSPHWKSTYPVFSYQGLLAVGLEPGDHEVLLTYKPWDFWIFAAANLLAVLILAGLFFRGKTREEEKDSCAEEDPDTGRVSPL
ncbi:MAG: hypothetical protein KKA60_11780 [Proteobacteria bacterium]|nr:hypothetical protein [Pseudomonadota bacterium]